MYLIIPTVPRIIPPPFACCIRDLEVGRDAQPDDWYKLEVSSTSFTLLCAAVFFTDDNQWCTACTDAAAILSATVHLSLDCSS
jgi:hypothetical protein